MTTTEICRTRLMQIINDELSKLSNPELEQTPDNQGLRLIGLKIQSILPEAIELIREHAERLSLQQNDISMLPLYFNRLHKLRYLDIHDNKFTIFPEILTKMDNLEILDISFNSLTHLPKELGNLRKTLKILSIKQNQFDKLPVELLQLKNLQLIELENNPFNNKDASFLSRTNISNNGQDWLNEIRPYLHSIKEAEEENIHQQQQYIHPVLERSRSVSESHVSSKASKRMGFIMVRPNLESPSSNEVISESRGEIGSNNGIRIETRHRSHTTLDPYDPGEFTQKLAFNNDNHGPTITGSSSNNTSHLGVSSSPNSGLDSIPEHKSNDYFKRLSALPETRLEFKQFRVIDISRKLLFSISEFQSMLKKLNSFCTDKQIIVDVVSQLYSSKTMIDRLVEVLEKNENLSEIHNSIDEFIKIVIMTIHIFKKLIDLINSNLAIYTKNIEPQFLRSFYLSLFLSYNEVLNAYKIISPDSPRRALFQTLQPQRIAEVGTTSGSTSTATASSATISTPGPSSVTISQQQATEINENDEKLYESLNNVLQSSQTVYSELNNSISKSAIATAKSEDQQFNSQLINKIKELTNTLVSSMDLNKKIKHKVSNPVIIKSFTMLDKKKFYDEINLFLKSIITILASTKSIINDQPLMLSEVKPYLANLTKATKDVAIMLEVSSYRLVNDNYISQVVQPSSSSTAAASPPAPVLPQQASLLSSIPSMMSIPQMNTPYMNISIHQQQQQAQFQQQQQQQAQQLLLQQNGNPLLTGSSYLQTPSLQQPNPFEASMMYNMSNGSPYAGGNMEHD